MRILASSEEVAWASFSSQPYLIFSGDLIVFAIFVGIIFKFGVKQVIAAVAARDAKIAEQLKQAEETEKQARDLQARLDKEMAGAEAKINELMADARLTAKNFVRSLLLTVKQRSKHASKSIARKSCCQNTGSWSMFKSKVGDLALLVAGKVLDAELDGGRNAELIQATLNEYQTAGASA